ncbi:MAG: tRNA threonylcarbamoyladenosine dehydratase [Chitinophagales bacterium]
MEIPEWMSRTELLLGTQALQKLMKAEVLIVGLGGVGGIAAEMLVRAGVGKLTLVDADVVEPSNRNRQIIATARVNGLLKSEILAARLRDINPEVQLELIDKYLEAGGAEALLAGRNFNYVADCIDTLQPKVGLIAYCKDHRIPLISSMGAGGRLNPQEIKISDISKTFNCYLAYYVRKKLHRMGIYQGVKVVFSPERPDKNRVKVVDGRNKKSVIGTISYMPNMFGCTVASVIIQGILNQKEKKRRP